VPVRDFERQDLCDNLSRCVEAIEAALAPGWAKAYLHCTAGINRSPTAAAAYLMKTQGMSAREAHEWLCRHRDCSPYLDVLENYSV
jgi:protein-tyrosine phosphatase